MPLYLFKNPKTGEMKEVIQSMRDEHVYFQDNEQWERVYTVPQGNVPASVDPFNPNSFVEATGQAKGTYGDVVDRARELSDKRKKILGKDPVQEKYFDKWSSKRNGRRHPQDKRPAQKIQVPKP